MAAPIEISLDRDRGLAMVMSRDAGQEPDHRDDPLRQQLRAWARRQQVLATLRAEILARLAARRQVKAPALSGQN